MHLDILKEMHLDILSANRSNILTLFVKFIEKDWIRASTGKILAFAMSTTEINQYTAKSLI